jgi:ribonuclease P protein component
MSALLRLGFAHWSQMIAANSRLRKHADYQKVYKSARKQFGGRMSYFFMLRTPQSDGPPTSDPSGPDPNAVRVGLTVPKALGGAVDRNRIKRRMRAAVRKQLPLLSAPVDVVLHPKRSAIDVDFAILEREVATVFRAIQQTAERRLAAPPPVAR